MEFNGLDIFVYKRSSEIWSNKSYSHWWNSMDLTYLSIKESVKSDQTSHLEQIRDSRFFALLNTFFMCSFLSQPATGTEEIASRCDPRWCRCFGIDEIHGYARWFVASNIRKKESGPSEEFHVFISSRAISASLINLLCILGDWCIWMRV